MGFSQGGVLTVILCLMRKHPDYFAKTLNVSADRIEHAPFKFAWIVGGFLPRCDALKPLLNDIAHGKQSVVDDVPLLLVAGKTDQYVSRDKVLDIGRYFEKGNVSVVEHERGHYVPADSHVKQQYLDFLKQI